MRHMYGARTPPSAPPEGGNGGHVPADGQVPSSAVDGGDFVDGSERTSDVHS